MVAELQKQAGQPQYANLLKLLSVAGHDTISYCAICFAIGLPNELVAELFGLLPEEIELYKRSPRISELSNQIQIALGMNHEKRLAAAVNLAIDTKMHLLRNGDDKIKNNVSTEVLDRNFGKPLQTTQNINANINTTVTNDELDRRYNMTDKRIQLLEEKRQKLLGSLK